MLLDDPPVKHGERTEMHRLTPAPNFFSRLAGLPENVVILVVPVMLAVNRDARGLEIMALEDAVDEKLQLAQRLALFADEPAGIRRGDMQEGRTVQQRLFDGAGNAQAGQDFLDDVFGIQWRGGWLIGIHLD